jgi:hypothetical protein
MKHIVALLLVLCVLGSSAGCSEGGKGINKGKDRPVSPDKAQPPEK